MKKTNLTARIILFCLLISTYVSAQSSFVKTYGHISNDKFTCMDTSRDGNLLIGGVSDFNFTYPNGNWILELNLKGDVLFDKSGAFVNQPNTITQDSENNMIFFAGDNLGICDRYGNLNGGASIGGWDEISRIRAYKNQGFVIAFKWLQNMSGYSYRYYYGMESYYTNSGYYFLDSLSKKQGAAKDFYYTADTGYITTGYVVDSPSGNNLSLVVNLDSTMKEKWRLTLNGSSNSQGIKTVMTRNGEYLVSGNITDSSKQKIYLAKISPSGNLLWSKIYYSPYSSSLSALAETMDGKYSMAGTFLKTAKDADIFLWKCDTGGNLIWQKNYGWKGFDSCSGMLVTKANNFVISGITNSIGAGQFDGLLIGMDSSGFVDLTAGIKEDVTTQKEVEIYPNPATDNLNFSFKNGFASNSRKELKLFDLAGRVIGTYSIKSGHLNVDCKNIPDGLYFYFVYEDNTQVKSGKIEILK